MIWRCIPACSVESRIASITAPDTRVSRTSSDTIGHIRARHPSRKVRAADATTRSVNGMGRSRTVASGIDPRREVLGRPNVGFVAKSAVPDWHSNRLVTGVATFADES